MKHFLISKKCHAIQHSSQVIQRTVSKLHCKPGLHIPTGNYSGNSILKFSVHELDSHLQG